MEALNPALQVCHQGVQHVPLVITQHYEGVPGGLLLNRAGHPEEAQLHRGLRPLCPG